VPCSAGKSPCLTVHALHVARRRDPFQATSICTPRCTVVNGSTSARRSRPGTACSAPASTTPSCLPSQRHVCVEPKTSAPRTLAPRRDVLARRQHRWRRSKGSDSKIFSPASICEKLPKKLKSKKFGQLPSLHSSRSYPIAACNEQS